MGDIPIATSPKLSEPLPDSEPLSEPAFAPSAYKAADIAEILRERGWLISSEVTLTAEQEAWCGRAAGLLGPQAADRDALADLLSLVFCYDAQALLQQAESQAVLMRKGSREVVRALANLLLDGGDVDSNRFQEIVEGIKAAVPYRSRSLFQPIRLALAGRAGEGEMDRVILLLDGAAGLPFATPVKGTHQRMLEFCAAFD